MYRPISVIACAILFAGTVSGCSWVFVRAPGDNVEAAELSHPPTCTKSRVAPVIDAIEAAGNLAIGAFGLVGTLDESTHSPYAPILMLGFVNGAIFTASATYGFSRTATCANLKESYRKRDSVQQ